MKTISILLATSLASICSTMADTQDNRSIQSDRTLKAIPPAEGFAEPAPAPTNPALKGDLEILGGVSFTLSVEPRVDAGGAKLPVTPAQVDETMIVIGKRLKGMGTADFNIARQGGNGILLQVPGARQRESARIRTVLERLIALTTNMRPGVDRIAIVLDGQVISAPVVQQVPLGKNFIIEGLNEPGEVETLANALMNPLELPLKIDEMRTILPKKNQ